jgi:hypothetical protein
VLIGGIGTLLVVVIWVKAFPALFRMGSFERLHTAPWGFLRI